MSKSTRSAKSGPSVQKSDTSPPPNVQSQKVTSKPSKLNLRSILALAGFALLVNFAVFLLSIKTSMDLSIPNAENWQDFFLSYVPAVNALKEGFLPYLNFYYPYPPPFLYVLTAFSYLPLPSWSSALALVIAEALTVIPVYLIAKEFVTERKSAMLSLLFVLSPMGLYYVDYLWLNPSLTTLFLMVSIYLLLRRHYDVSAVTIGLAVGFKQTALFALPIMALIAWRSGSNRMVGLRYLLLGAGVCVLLSLPFLVEVPRLYLESIVRFPQNLCGTTQDYCSIATGTGSPISLNLANEITAKWNLVASGVNNPVNLVLPVFIFLLPASTSILYPSYSAYLILILLVAYAFFLYRTGRLQRFDAKDFLLYVLFALLLLFVFYPLYKYYAVGIIPLLVLLVRSKRDAAGFVAFNLVLLFVPRYLAPLFLLVTLLWLLRARFHKRYITYALVAATAFLVVFTPFVAASAVAFPYTPGAASPPCASGGTLTITTAMSFAESCVLQPHSTINETSAIEIPSGAHASFSVNSTSALPVNVLVRDNTNGYILLEKTSVTFALSSFSLSYGTSYSLVIVNDSNQNNTISISSTISV